MTIFGARLQPIHWCKRKRYVSTQLSGFTLIELMITLAIISLIAAVAVPSYTGYVNKTKVAEAFAMMQEVKNSVSATYSGTGDFPSAITTFFEDTSADADFSEIYWHPGTSGTEGGIIIAKFGPGAADELDDRRLFLKPDAANGFSIVWHCTNHHMAQYAIPDEMLPADCTAFEP